MGYVDCDKENNLVIKIKGAKNVKWTRRSPSWISFCS